MNFSNFLQRWKVFPPSHLGDWTNWKWRWLFHIFPEKFKTQLFIQLCLSLVNCILVQQNNQVDCIFHFHVDIFKSQIYTAAESRWRQPTHDDGVGDNPNWKMKKLKREIKHESCLTCVIRDVLPQLCHTKHGNFVSKKNKIQTLCDKFKHWKFSISIHIQ